MEINNVQTLRSKISKDLVIPFIGAGISMDAKMGNDRYPPSDKYLLDELLSGVEKAGNSIPQEVRSGDRSSMTKFLRSCYGKELGIKIRQYLSYKRITPSQHQRILGLLRFKFLITTNYDTIIGDVIYPRPEPFVAHNKYNLDYAIKEVHNGENTRPILIKLNGCQSQPESIALGHGLDYYNEYWQHPFLSLYEWKKDLSLLFIGYSLNDQDFIKFMIDLRNRLGIQSQNYVILTIEEYQKLNKEDFVDKLNLKFIPYKSYRDENRTRSFKGLWEILSQLKTDNMLDLSPGAQSGVFFSKDQRDSYLSMQEFLESKSTCLRYLTPSPTNALSPEEYITSYCPNGLKNLYKSFEFQLFQPGVDEDEWVSSVVSRMISRKKTIHEMMTKGTEIRVLCLESEVKKDFHKKDEFINKKYRYIVDVIDNKKYDLEVRLIEGTKIDKDSINSFALMSSPNATQTDLSIAYAAQANKGSFKLHVLERNTNFAHNHLIHFEGIWARSLPENKTRDYLYNLFVEQNIENETEH